MVVDQPHDDGEANQAEPIDDRQVLAQHDPRLHELRRDSVDRNESGVDQAVDPEQLDAKLGLGLLSGIGFVILALGTLGRREWAPFAKRQGRREAAAAA